MFQIQFLLKQHTPLIHFQHDQDGATLRASEVKPLLDKFLIDKYSLTSNGLPTNNTKIYFNNVLKNSLDYKLSVECNQKKEYFISSYISKQKISELERQRTLYINGAPYFGDSKGITWDIIKINFKTFNPSVQEILKESVLQEFFFLNNFGNRKSKGFGSFTLHKESIPESGEIIKSFEETARSFKSVAYKKEIKKTSDLSTIFSEINLSFQILKSGVNFPGKYQKSDLFKYFAKKGREIGWEKRKIKIEINKQKVFSEKLFSSKYEPLDFDYEKDKLIFLNTWNEVDKPNYKFVRALLGLAETNEYLIEYDGEADKQSKYIVEIIPTNNDVERMASPITFKVIENIIYVIAKQIPDKIFDSKFDFILRLKKKRKDKWELEKEKTILVSDLAVPAKEQFNLIEFLDEFLIIKGYIKI